MCSNRFKVVVSGYLPSNTDTWTCELVLLYRYMILCWLIPETSSNFHDILAKPWLVTAIILVPSWNISEHNFSTKLFSNYVAQIILNVIELLGHGIPITCTWLKNALTILITPFYYWLRCKYSLFHFMSFPYVSKIPMFFDISGFPESL